VIFSVLTHHKTLPPTLVAIKNCLPDENHIFEVWEKMASECYENVDEFHKEWRQICEFIHRDDLLKLKLNLDTPLSNNIVKWLDRSGQTKFF
jgi:hypothetical protein